MQSVFHLDIFNHKEEKQKEFAADVIIITEKKTFTYT
jgi:hypothetical protein